MNMVNAVQYSLLLSIPCHEHTEKQHSYYLVFFYKQRGMIIIMLYLKCWMKQYVRRKFMLLQFLQEHIGEGP